MTTWITLPPQLRHWRARYRLRRSIAHLDERLLADVGLHPRDLGFGQRLMRRYGAGGDIWSSNIGR